MRALHKLTNTKVKSGSLKPGRHSDGGGLYLNVSPSGSKSWVFMWSRGGKRREMGLGSYPAIALSRARTRASECRDTVGEGGDPIAQSQSGTGKTFGECADQFIASMESSWRNEKHRAQWRMTLNKYCEPLRNYDVSEIDTQGVLQVLRPIWNEKPETASRVRGRIECVIDFAKANDWRTGENPARWRGHLKNILPARRKLTRGHHSAMPYRDVPEFVGSLRGSDAIAAHALEFLILTAARTGEVLNARWNETNLARAIWTIPAERMKAGQQHRVPLSSAAVDILRVLHDRKISDFVFPGQRPGRPLSSSAMTMLMRRLKADQYTVHGFRSAFRDWAGDHTEFAREVAEAALAHRVGDATEQAYRREDAIEKRARLMAAWEEFIQKGLQIASHPKKSRKRGEN